METIDQKLDRLFPVTCVNCKKPLSRVNDKYICKVCGLDARSAGAYNIERSKNS